MSRKLEGQIYKNRIKSTIGFYQEKNKICIESAVIAPYDGLHAGGVPIVEGSIIIKEKNKINSGYDFEINNLTKQLEVTCLDVKRNKNKSLKQICDLNNSIGKSIGQIGIDYLNLSDDMKKTMLSLGENYKSVFNGGKIFQVII